MSFRALGDTLLNRTEAARRTGAFGATAALSRLARATRALSVALPFGGAEPVDGVLDGGVVGLEAGVDGVGAGTGAGDGGAAHADTTSTTAAIFILQSFADAHTASIALTRARGKFG